MNDTVKARIAGYTLALTSDMPGDDSMIDTEFDKQFPGQPYDVREAFHRGFLDAHSAEEYISITQAATEAGVGRQYIKDEVRRGNLPAIKVGRQYQIARSDFSRWAQRPGRGSRSAAKQNE